MLVPYFRAVRWYRHLFWPVAMIYGAGVALRNLLFDAGLLRSQRFDVPVICVGNLETGGTGKSPMVVYLTDIFLKQGYRLGVVSRGYGRSTSGFRWVAADDPVETVGDEPKQLKQRYPQIAIAVCEDRVRGIEVMLEDEPSIDVIIMDDGFQHRWVRPSFTVLTTSSFTPIDQNHLLPVGSMREPISSLKRADAVVVTGTRNASLDHAQTFSAEYDIGEPVRILGSKPLPAGSQVFAFSGIAQPERFLQVVEQHFDLVGHHVFPDHHRFAVSDIRMLQQKMDSFGLPVQVYITTEKDATRLKDSEFERAFGKASVYYLPIDLKIANGKEQEFNEMMLSHGKDA